ncbi:hypothetical protein GGQ80_003502 [Sphingomonas jinjuensis]|uniref:Peptidase S10 n=1 Tax=Sphingomonas jinjuensis TaxID=535907 RepID=A0A840FIQ5_9SPHN|nr:peptidase S10 [Sphingomonas jinjuensis]MBB4155577.1 hypothetical protein [Sphingomonas jinjuensis]
MIRCLFPALLLAAPAASAQQQPALAAVTIPAPIVTDHVGTFAGKRVAYRAAIESFDATTPDGKPVARLAAISYVARDATAARPVLFVFNGGPIAPSAILHMGAFGPRRVAIPDDVTAPPASFRVVDNPDTVLDVADIVFFDPAGTGFSRLAPGVDAKSQFGNVADARQLQQLVLAWTKAHGRERSPVYLVGESYGTMRAPEAAKQLAAVGRAPAGLILIGQAVNIIEYAQRRGNIISYAVSLPTLAATAWWHGKADRRGRSFDRFVADAERWGAGEYLTLLFAGDTAPLPRRQAAAAELQAFTGIPADHWLSNALRMTKTDYQRALFPGRLLGTNDARYVGPLEGPQPFDAIPDAYQAQLQRYLATDLKAAALGSYTTDNPFQGGLNDWNWGPNISPFGDWPYGRAITDLFAADPAFRLFVANGYYDTQTTIGAMDYLLAQSGWPRTRVRSAKYQGGHMPYTIDASLKRLMTDIRAMVTRQW